MRPRLFQYAIIYHPTEKEEKEGKKAFILKELTTVLAKDEKEVSIIASRLIPEDFMKSLENIEIAIRPF